MNQPKFEVGQVVKFLQDSDADAGKIVGLSFDGEGWVYKIASKEVDLAKKEIIDGFKTGKEEELVVMEEVEVKVEPEVNNQVEG